MRTIKEYLKEDFFDNLPISKKIAIEGWLKKYNIKNYTINDDWTIDAKKVFINNYKSSELPNYIIFNNVNDFTFYNCKNLTSLKGCPVKCKYFKCSDTSIKTLEGAPKECEEFICSHCEYLISLEGAPKECIKFDCSGCKGKFTEEDVRKVCNAKNIYC